MTSRSPQLARVGTPPASSLGLLVAIVVGTIPPAPRARAAGNAGTITDRVDDVDIAANPTRSIREAAGPTVHARAVADSMLAGPAAASGEAAESDGYTLGVHARARLEWWKGLVASPVAEKSYDFWSLRLRPYLRYSAPNIRFFFQVQYAGGFGLPSRRAGGPGGVYFGVNDERAPQSVEVLELHVDVVDFPVTGLDVRLGRQGIKGGEEVLYPDQHVLDWVKKSRLSERLVGEWDWTNLGRRYDAATATYRLGQITLAGVAARVLTGGFSYHDATEPLEDVDELGLSVTLHPGLVLPATELRFFDWYYYDNRASARGIAGGDLKIDTLGVSLAGAYDLGPGVLDAMAWGAVQLGKWGAADQVAFAGIGEVGYQLRKLALGPWLRTGLAYASGDGTPASGSHQTFFNMTPTNHKFYGDMDTTAFENLLNYYAQLFVTPLPPLRVRAELLLFWLADPSDSWYAGSGPSNDATFGYAGGYDAATRGTSRLTNGRRFVGTELDLVATWKVAGEVELSAGYSHFFGGAGAQQVFPAAPDGDWAYAELVVHVP